MALIRLGIGIVGAQSGLIDSARKVCKNLLKMIVVWPLRFEAEKLYAFEYGVLSDGDDYKITTYESAQYITFSDETISMEDRIQKVLREQTEENFFLSRG